MSTQRVADDVLGRIAIKQDEIFRRVKAGALPEKWVSDLLQEIIEGPNGPRARNRTQSPDAPATASVDGHYTIHVDYAPLPSIKDLERQFSGEQSISGLFDGRAWENHESCKDMDETPGDRDFLVHQFNQHMTSKSVIDWAKANGYRVATHKEALAFAAKHPDLQRQFWIVALGSSTLHDDDYRYVAVLFSDGRRRLLHGHWFGNAWYAGHRFLLVRK